jgi:GNAT superfamily N-acetyltransferase
MTPGPEITTCVTDDDYEAWRRVRVDVVPGERSDTVEEMRARDTASRLLLLATVDGTVVGSGLADRSNLAGGGFVAPRVLREHRRRGVGSALLRSLASHVETLGLAELRAMTEDEGSLAFAERFGFVEVDRQVEQVRAVGDEPEPAPLPEGVEVVTSQERPGLWASSYERFGTEVMADFAVYQPLEVLEEEWTSSWAGDPMFLAVHEGEVVGCAGLDRDTDKPERAENALTAVRRDWRGHGIAEHLKRRTLRWAADHDVAELYTWTQAGNVPMITLNERLGYVRGSTSITLSRPVPL